MTQHRFRHFRRLPLAFCIAGLVLAGCGKDDGKKAASQVAARVNSDEISVHQINDVLGKTPGITAENAATAKREILAKLVDRQLAVQQAQEKKLDRSPAVLSAIESARSDILARAYLEQLVSAQAKPTEAEAKAYYAAHPELFSERRVFNLQEIIIPARPDLLPAVREQVAQGKAPTALAAWLKAGNVKFGANGGARAAEQIPLEVLPRIHALKDGQTIVLSDGRTINVTYVAASQAQPIDEATAVPRIQQFLANQRANEQAQKEMAALREKAKIEYIGEFVGTAAAAAAPAARAATPATPATPVTPVTPATPATTPAPAKAAAAPQKAPPTAANIEKGLAGLK